MDALWIVRTGIESSRARKRRSVCVVALSGVLAGVGAGGRGEPWGGGELPERVADDEEGYISGRGRGENRVGRGLNHFSVCDDDGAVVELLLYRQTPSALFETHRWGIRRASFSFSIMRMLV